MPCSRSLPLPLSDSPKLENGRWSPALCKTSAARTAPVRKHPRTTNSPTPFPSFGLADRSGSSDAATMYSITARPCIKDR
ncbi:hypothetical protein [uncultured Bacteroides sp.]|uniref:hypothetical protein n=1 Tax=uncultured Bacteroides sp. TaxID=162156 RepID=UPI0034548553